MFTVNTTPNNLAESLENFGEFLEQVFPRIQAENWKVVTVNQTVVIWGKGNNRIGWSNHNNTWTEYTLLGEQYFVS